MLNWIRRLMWRAKYPAMARQLDEFTLGYLWGSLGAAVCGARMAWDRAGRAYAQETGHDLVGYWRWDQETRAMWLKVGEMTTIVPGSALIDWAQRRQLDEALAQIVKGLDEHDRNHQQAKRAEETHVYPN